MSDDIHALAGAYALDALDDLERARFEQHLARCRTCQDDVDGYRATATRLASASATPPSPAVRGEVLARIGQVRQEPAVVRAVSTRRRLVAPVLAAAAAVALVVAGVALVDARNDSDRERQLTMIVTSPDADRIDLAATPDAPAGASGSLVWSLDQEKAVVRLDGLPDPGSGRAYALWFIVDGTPRPAALLDGEGNSLIAVVDAPPAEVEAIGITDEPAGGSESPTTPILLLGSV